MAGFRWIVFLFALCFSSFSSAAERIVLQLKWVNQFQFAGYYAAVEKGFYKAAGLDVELRPNGYNGSFVSPVDAVLKGDAQYGISNSGLVLDYLNGKPVVVLAATLQHSAVSWIVLEKSGIRSIHDMAKKRLMTAFPLTESLELLEPFRAEGIPPDKLQLVQTGFDIQPLIDGEIDAYDGYVTNEPFLLEEKGIPYRLIDPRTYGIDFYGDVLFTSQNELNTHPERVAAFRKASMDGWRYAMKHPEEIIELIMQKYAPQKTREHLRFEAKAMWNLMQPDIIEIGHMNPGRWLRIAEVMTEHQRLVDAQMLNRFIYNQDDYQLSLSRYVRIAVISSIMAFLLAGIVIWTYRTNRRLQREVEARQQAEQQLRHLSETDALTGLANRRAFDQQLRKEFQRFLRYSHPFSIVMVDIDWFKRINDTYGHKAGDWVIRKTGEALGRLTAEDSLPFRFGGDEFLLLTREESGITAESIRQSIAAVCKEEPSPIREPLEASIGVILAPWDSEYNMDVYLNQADEAMYEEKKMYHEKYGDRRRR